MARAGETAAAEKRELLSFSFSFFFFLPRSCFCVCYTTPALLGVGVCLRSSSSQEQKVRGVTEPCGLKPLGKNTHRKKNHYGVEAKDAPTH